MRYLLTVGAIVLLAVSGLVVYTETRPVQLPEGLSIAGVDLGGLSPTQAERRLTSVPGPEADRLVVGDRRYRLNPSTYGVTDDRGELLAAAVRRAEGRSGWSRAFGSDRGDRVRTTVRVDERRVKRLVRRVAARERQEPVDATIRLTDAGPRMRPAEDGQRLRQAELRERLLDALRRPESDTITGQVEPVPARVRTRSDVTKRYPTSIVVDRRERRARLYRGLRLVKTYRVAIGSVGHESPSGLYDIANKAVDPVWNVPNSAWAGSLAGATVPPGPQNPLKARWMGIVDGVGFHGTAEDGSIGTAASHGCFRMHVPDVIDLYDRVDVGTPVLIV